jgi:TM2 domain-containing membrane protein YozV
MMLAGLFSFSAKAERLLQPGDTIFVSDTAGFRLPQEFSAQQDFIKADDTKKKKFVSAMFAFPFPFGFMGAHRVMLGTKPWVPVVYVATFGGCFGLLPLIDFCVLTFSKDITPYENNPNIFMWVTDKPSHPESGTD